MDLDDVVDLFELVGDFIRGYWKPLLIFLILVITGVAITLYQTIDSLEETEKDVQEQTKGIVDSFVQVGEDTGGTISDPIARVSYQLLWRFLGICVVLIILIPIGQAFKEMCDSLNPVNIARSFK